MLSECEIVQLYRVSRVAVREAILGLANKGLIKPWPGYRRVVINLVSDTALAVAGGVVTQLSG